MFHLQWQGYAGDERRVSLSPLSQSPLARSLAETQGGGIQPVETYVFWNYHEPQEGKVDLSEFEEFVKLVHEMGFMMIVRPGPYICAEWERGGFPSWVAAKRFPLRTPDPQSLRTSEHWYAEILPVIQKYQVT